MKKIHFGILFLAITNLSCGSSGTGMTVKSISPASGTTYTSEANMPGRHEYIQFNLDSGTYYIPKNGDWAQAFSITGTCATNPTALGWFENSMYVYQAGIGSVGLQVTEGSCQNGDTFTVTLDLSQVCIFGSNAVTGRSRTPPTLVCGTGTYSTTYTKGSGYNSALSASCNALNNRTDVLGSSTSQPVQIPVTLTTGEKVTAIAVYHGAHGGGSINDLLNVQWFIGGSSSNVIIFDANDNITSAASAVPSGATEIRLTCDSPCNTGWTLTYSCSL